MQQTRTYGQQRSMVMHQQQPLFDASMYTCGIPTATQRTPGMPGMGTPMCVAPQMRQVMVPAPNGMMMQTGGAAMPQAYSRPRSSTASVSPGYPAGTTPTYPQGQSMMVSSLKNCFFFAVFFAFHLSSCHTGLNGRFDCKGAPSESLVIISIPLRLVLDDYYLSYLLAAFH